MVLTLAIPLRAFYGLEDFITMRHLDNMAKVMLVDRPDRRLRLPDRSVHRAGTARNMYEEFMMLNRMFGPYGVVLLGADPLQRHDAAAALVQEAPHERDRAVRRSRIVVNVGMWLERFVIIVVSLHRDFLPSSWGMYSRDDLGLGDVPRHDRPVPVACCSCSSASCR